jgi:nitroimidazol reductase NimA-like FMN-containing flavoprotein (pyridoxamine 5'-phosphate oxidase superfamily)
MKRRSQVALTADEQAAFLNESHVAALSTVDKDGFPHLVAMIFVAREGAIFMTSWAKAQKVLNIRRNPKVGILIEDGATYADYRGISIRGTCEIIEDPEEVLGIMRSIVGRQVEPAATEPPPGSFDHIAKRVALKITPVKIASWDHRKLGGRY